jgi:hypothetical protein
MHDELANDDLPQFLARKSALAMTAARLDPYPK